MLQKDHIIKPCHERPWFKTTSLIHHAMQSHLISKHLWKNLYNYRPSITTHNAYIYKKQLEMNAKGINQSVIKLYMVNYTCDMIRYDQIDDSAIWHSTKNTPVVRKHNNMIKLVRPVIPLVRNQNNMSELPQREGTSYLEYQFLLWFYVFFCLLWSGGFVCSFVADVGSYLPSVTPFMVVSYLVMTAQIHWYSFQECIDKREWAFTVSRAAPLVAHGHRRNNKPCQWYSQATDKKLLKKKN